MTFSGRLGPRWLWPVAAAWTLLLAAEITGLTAAGGHHALIEGDRWPWGISLAFFASLWLVMVSAMMLPVNLPMLDALRGGGGGAPAAFLAGYGGVWLAFGAAVFVGDAGVHSLTHSWRWLHENGWAVLAATLAVVGLFQAAPAKRRYLERCRHEIDYVARHSDGGWTGALVQGLRHGGVRAPVLLGPDAARGRRRARPRLDPGVHGGDAGGEGAVPGGSFWPGSRGRSWRCRAGPSWSLACSRRRPRARRTGVSIERRSCACRRRGAGRWR